MTDTQEFSPRGPRRRARAGKRILLGGLFALVLVLGGIGSWFAWAMGGVGGGAKVQIAIRAGAPASEIATELANKGVVRSAFVFRVIARMRGVSSDFKPGTYVMREGIGVSAAITALRTGIPEEVDRFTIPEGLTVKEIADEIERQTHVSARDFLAALLGSRSRPEVLKAHFAGKKRFTVADFEGMLFPNTYEIFKKSSAPDVVKLLLDQFQERAEDLGLAAGARARGLSPYQLVIVASLVEKEARRADEQDEVASVIYNRLAKPMRLQIDATIQYVYIQQTGHVKNPLQETDYRLDSIYNTYQHDGLPPTPIAAPGIGALRAAIDPAETDLFFYRLCNPEALRFGHIFGRTLGERDRKWQSDPRCA